MFARRWRKWGQRLNERANKRTNERTSERANSLVTLSEFVLVVRSFAAFAVFVHQMDLSSFALLAPQIRWSLDQFACAQPSSKTRCVHKLRDETEFTWSTGGHLFTRSPYLQPLLLLLWRKKKQFARDLMATNKFISSRSRSCLSVCVVSGELKVGCHSISAQAAQFC